MDKWIIDEESSEEVRSTIQSRPNLIRHWHSFEKDIAANPFYHPARKRIQKLKGKAYKDLLRYSKSDLRVVYYPEKEKKVVYPIEAASATDIGYKKRSRK